ncbi:chloromuconate cycloisomerase [bacterium]|nr:chloromuconate cycloisomerase [bacterium]
MKIRSISATPVNIPLRAPYRFSYGSTASLTKTMVEVLTEDGVVGLGECADGDRAAEVVAAGQRLIGLDLRAITTARNLIVPGMAYTPWGNVAAARRVFGGIEMAMWDARGKTEGVPLTLLLGGAVRDQIALTEYFSYRLPGVDPGESSPVEIARYCAAMVEAHGSPIFEGKVATVALSEEVTMLREIRAAIGHRDLRIDANGGYTLPIARRALRAFSPFDVSWFEEPCESYEEMAALRRHTDISFSSHRIDLSKAVALGAPDAIVTNLNELGGIAATVDFIKAADGFNLGFRFHSGETGVASAAYLQVSAAVEAVRDASQTLLRWYGDDVIEGGPLVPKAGVVKLPDGPGLGVTLDRTALARCHQRYLDEGAFPSGVAGLGYGGRFRKL